MKIVHLCHKGLSVAIYMPLSKSVKFSYPSTWLVKTDQTLFWIPMSSRTPSCWAPSRFRIHRYMACNNRRGKTAEFRLQAPGMEEAADPSVKDIFRYKIPASFIPVRGAPIMSPMRLPSHANWASHRSAVTTNPLWREIRKQSSGKARSV
jgi:hypothetical protein